MFNTNLTCELVKSEADMQRLLDYGHKIRVAGRTDVNARSSRSHAVVSVHIERLLHSITCKRKHIETLQIHKIMLRAMFGAKRSPR